MWLRLALRQVLFYSLACTICGRHRRRSETRVVLDICRRISACSFASLAARFRRRTGRAAGASEERRRSWERYGRVLPLPPRLDSACAIEDSIVKLRRYLVRNGQLRSWGTQRDLLVHETACLCIELVAYHSVVAYHHRQLRSSSTLFPALAAAPRGWHMSVESKRRAGPGCLVHHNTLGLHVCVCVRARERMRVRESLYVRPFLYLLAPTCLLAQANVLWTSKCTCSLLNPISSISSARVITAICDPGTRSFCTTCITESSMSKSRIHFTTPVHGIVASADTGNRATAADPGLSLPAPSTALATMAPFRGRGSAPWPGVPSRFPSETSSCAPMMYAAAP